MESGHTMVAIEEIKNLLANILEVLKEQNKVPVKEQKTKPTKVSKESDEQA